MAEKRKKPPTGFKPTRAEHERRVDEAGALVAHGATKSQVVAIFRERYDVHWQTVQNYLARARQVALERAGRTKADAVSQAVAFYEGLVRDTAVPLQQRMLARERLDKIFGVYQPQQVRIGTNPGQPIESKSEATAKSEPSSFKPTLEQMRRWADEDQAELAKGNGAHKN